MSELPQLETRIAAAFQRIKSGLDEMANAPPPEPVAPPEPQVDVAHLNAQIEHLTRRLEDEQAVNAQLEDRVSWLKERQDGKLSQLQSSLDAARARAARMDRELQRLREVNADLREINTELRDAVTEGVSEPHLVNKAMLAELDALRTNRTADVAEMDAILQELTPILEREAADATD